MKWAWCVVIAGGIVGTVACGDDDDSPVEDRGGAASGGSTTGGSDPGASAGQGGAREPAGGSSGASGAGGESGMPGRADTDGACVYSGCIGDAECEDLLGTTQATCADPGDGLRGCFTTCEDPEDCALALPSAPPKASAAITACASTPAAKGTPSARTARRVRGALSSGLKGARRDRARRAAALRCCATGESSRKPLGPLDERPGVE